MRKLDPYYKTWCGMPYALSKYADVKYYGPGFEGCITNADLKAGKKIDALKIIDELYKGDYPDIIIQGDPHMKGLFIALENFHKADCLRVIWMVDLHNCVGRNDVMDYIRDGNIDLVLKAVDVKNITEWGNKLKDTGVNVEWYPFSVNTEIFYDRNLPKIYDVTNIGVMSSQCYPIRLKIHQYFTENGKSLVKIVTNGKSQLNNIKNGIKYHWSNFRGEAYSEDINKSKIFVAGNSSFNWPLQKFFEVFACNTLFMSNNPVDSKELGFKSGVNFAEINAYPRQVSETKIKDFLEPIEYYLSHPEESMKIAKRGYDLVHSRHTNEIRAKEIIDKISKFT